MTPSDTSASARTGAAQTEPAQRGPAQAATLETPDGPFTVIVREGTVLASGWTSSAEELAGLIHPRLRPDSLEPVDADDDRLAPAVRAVRAYYEGDLTAPRSVPVEQDSGEFLVAAWSALRDVKPGERITYTEYAERAGRPAAVRAAASACAKNAAALFVPCHRIVRTDGGLGGFRYGEDVKESLLKREAAARG